MGGITVDEIVKAGANRVFQAIVRQHEIAPGPIQGKLNHEMKGVAEDLADTFDGDVIRDVCQLIEDEVRRRLSARGIVA